MTAAEAEADGVGAADFNNEDDEEDEGKVEARNGVMGPRFEG